MSDMTNEHTVPYVVIRKDIAKTDQRLQQPGNTGRKVFAITMYEAKEKPIQEPEWEPGDDDQEKTPLVVTGFGGLEVATFNHHAKQEAHKHLIGTEIFTVLEGEMEIIINEKDCLTLGEGDEIVLLPGTVHEILTNRQFLVRVHCVDCHGVKDKYVKVNGEWTLQYSSSVSQ
jgi:quercetin dioxygenase-like cupin family protein